MHCGQSFLTVITFQPSSSSTFSPPWLSMMKSTTSTTFILGLLLLKIWPLDMMMVVPLYSLMVTMVSSASFHLPARMCICVNKYVLFYISTCIAIRCFSYQLWLPGSPHPPAWPSFPCHPLPWQQGSSWQEHWASSSSSPCSCLPRHHRPPPAH